jgi:PAS domain S-box-containing protein
VALPETQRNSGPARETPARQQPQETLPQEAVCRQVLFDVSPDGILIIDPETMRFLEFNETAHRQLGYSREEFARLRIPDLEARETEDETRARIAAVLRDGKADFDTLQRTRAGEIRHVHVTAQVVQILGHPVYHCTWRDVTERKRAEEALRASEEKYRELVEDLNDVLFIIDTEGIITYISAPARQVTGYQPDELVGHPFAEFIHADDLPGLARSFQDTLAHRLEPWEFRYRRKDGQTRWARTSSRPILAGDRVLGIHGLFSDITEQKNARQRLLEYQNRLRELSARLTETEERERRHLAVWLHDEIGQRVALVKLALQSLGASTVEPQTVRVLHEVCQEIDGIIEDTHLVTFELSNPVLYETGFVNAVECWLAEQVYGKHGIPYTFQADPHVALVDKDMGVALFQVIRELLTNVVKHAQAGHVTVRMRKVGDAVQIVVQDDGLGFDSSTVGRPDPQAGGYGLFNARERVQYLGGTFVIDTAPGQGTCISIAVPGPAAQTPHRKEQSPYR